MNFLKSMMLVAATSSFAVLASTGPVAAQARQGSISAPVGQCTVSIDRSAESGTFSVVRQKITDQSCVCAVTTGDASQSPDVERRLASLVESRTCADARTVSLARETVPENASGLTGRSGGLLPILLGGAAAAIAGLIIVLDDDDAPVSP